VLQRPGVKCLVGVVDLRESSLKESTSALVAPDGRAEPGEKIRPTRPGERGCGQRLGMLETALAIKLSFGMRLEEVPCNNKKEMEELGSRMKCQELPIEDQTTREMNERPAISEEISK
jgi:hypothetical protein